MNGRTEEETRKAMELLLAIIFGEYPDTDERFVLARDVAVKFGFDMKELT